MSGHPHFSVRYRVGRIRFKHHYFSVSIQAGENNYCTPRRNEGPWGAFEIGFPNLVIEEWLEHAEEAHKPKDTVYGHVPRHLIEPVIERFGGWAEVLIPGKKRR
jgi:hypothetical protein